QVVDAHNLGRQQQGVQVHQVDALDAQLVGAGRDDARVVVHLRAVEGVGRDFELLPLQVARGVLVGERLAVGEDEVVADRRAAQRVDAAARRVAVVRRIAGRPGGPYGDAFGDRVDGRPGGSEGGVRRVRIIGVEVRAVELAAVEIAIPDRQGRLGGRDVEIEAER